MAKSVKPILLGLSILIGAALLSVLFVPAVSRFILEQSAFHFLNHRLEIRAYHFNLQILYFDGTFDDNSTVRVKGSHLFSPARRIDIALAGRSSFFDPLAGTKLPDVDFNATAFYADGRINATVRLLGGTVHADFTPATSRYAYALEGIRLGQLLRAAGLPAYVSGSVSGFGDGLSISPYSHRSTLTSYNIRPAEALIETAKAILLEPMSDSNLTVQLTFEEGHLLRSVLRVASTPFSLDLNESVFDFESGAFSFSAFLSNRQIDKLPVGTVATHGAGHFRDKHLAGDFTADSDAYRLRLENLQYAAGIPSLSSGFHVTSHSKLPYDLTGPNALHGRLAYTNDRLDANLTGRAMNEPLRITYENANVAIISNNIPIKTITSVLNRPDKLQGFLDLNGTVDTRAAYPAVSLALNAEKLLPDSELAEELNLTRPGRLSLVLKGKDGRYRAEVSTDSQLVEKGAVRIDYDAFQKRAKADGILKKLTLPWFRSSDIKLHTEADLSKRILSDTKLSSPFETLSVPSFELSKASTFTLDYRIGALERFIPDANRSLELKGSANVSPADVHLIMNGIGTADFSFGTPQKQLTVTRLKLQNVFSILGRPAPLRGDLDLTLHFDEHNATVAMHAERLTPSPELNASLRPFSLVAAAVFAHRDWKHFYGRARFETEHDAFLLTNVYLDLARRSVAGNYRLDIDDVSRTALVIPSDILEGGLLLTGNLEADVKIQSLSLHTERFAFDRRIHRLVDKNATDGMPAVIDLKASHNAQGLEVNASAISEHIALSPVRVSFRRAASALSLDALLNTDMKIGRTAVRFNGTFDGRAVSQGTLNVTARSEALEMTHIRIDPEQKDYEADIRLALHPLNAEDAQKEAVVYGSIDTRPALNAGLHTESFEGNLSAAMNDDLLVVHAAGLSVPQLLHFVSTSPLVTAGTVSGSVILNTPPLLEGNFSNLSGGIDIRTRDIRIEGIDLDGYLETLRGTQDLSLFQGSLSELPIVRAVKNLPETLLTKKPIRTDITRARFGAAVTNGMLVCEDCAAATPRHRVAFAGNIDLVSRRFDHFYAALINPQGCPYFMQRINGTLSDPRVNLAESGVKVIGGAVVSLASNVTDAANWLTGMIYKVTSATGEVISYVPIAGKRTDQALTSVAETLHGATSTECTPFYIGTIPPPTGK